MADKAAEISENLEQKPAASSTAADADNGALEMVMLRNDFYRENYRRLTAVMLMLVGLVGASFAFVFYMYATRPAPQYFATTTEGAIIRLQPLSEPNLQTSVLLSWASNAATQAFTYNFVDYKQALQDNRVNFTPRGYQNFLKALQDSNNLEAVINKKLVVSAVPQGTPVIVQEGLAGDRYAWRVQIPMLVSYQSSQQDIKQSIMLTLLITRVPTLEAPKGVGIAQFVVREAR